MPRLHVSPLPPRTKAQSAAQIRAQFRYARFSPQDYLKDQALIRAIDLGKPVTVKQFRALVRKHRWSEAWLITCVEDDLPYADRLVHRLLHEDAAGSTAIPRPLLTLYWRFKDVTPDAPVTATSALPGRTCACNCGERVWGRQRFASQACQKRCYRRAS
jgi:hypothetical protein